MEIDIIQAPFMTIKKSKAFSTMLPLNVLGSIIAAVI